MRDEDSRRQSLGLLLALAGVLIFAGTLPATRLAVGDLEPWFLTAGRAADRKSVV